MTSAPSSVPDRRAAGVLLAAALALLAPGTPAQERLERVFPDSTLGVLLLDDVQELRQRWDASAFGRMLADPALSGVRERLSAGWRAAGRELQERTGVDVLGLVEMVRGEVGVALLDFVPLDESDAFRPALALVVRVGEDVEAFADAIDRLVDWAVEEQGLLLKTEDVAGGEVAILLDAEQDEPSELQYGFFDQALVAVVVDARLARAGHLEEIVHSLRGEGRSALADAPAWKESMTTPLSALRVFFDLGALVERGGGAAGFAESMDDAPQGFGPIAELLGLDDLGALSIASDLGPKGTRGIFQLSFTRDAGAIPQVLAAAAGDGDPSLLALVPGQAEMAVAVDVDFAGAWDAVVAATMRHDPEAGRKLAEGLVDAEEAAGFHPRDDLLENLDGQMAFFVAKVEPGESLPMLPPGTAPQNFLLMFGLRDGAAMRTLVDAAVRKQGAHTARQREEFEGYEIYAVPTVPGVSLVYAVLDDLFLVSLAPSLVKDVLRRRLHEDLPSLVTSKGFAESLATLPRRRDVLGYEPGRTQPEGFLQALGMLQALSSGIDLDPGASEALGGLPQTLLGMLDGLELPDAAVLEKYFERPSLTALSFDGRGVRGESVGP